MDKNLKRILLIEGIVFVNVIIWGSVLYFIAAGNNLVISSWKVFVFDILIRYFYVVYIPIRLIFLAAKASKDKK
jgi:hypothetical protein